MRTAIVAYVLACVGVPALAQDVEHLPTAVESGIPDPTTVAVPVITGGRDERVIRDGWKHFYFWRADTTYEQAYADFADRYRFLPVPDANIMVPTFVAWQGDESLDAVEPSYSNSYGIVGAAIGAMVAGPIARRASQSRMRRCLEPRGYLRFPVREETWEVIIDDYSRASIAVGARIASGPRPDAEPVSEDR